MGETHDQAPGGSAAIPPAITPETAPFWAAGAEGRLVVEHCELCGASSHPPRGICRHCRNRQLVWREITEIGSVYSYTINHQRWSPNLEVPFAIVLVEFASTPGVRVVGRLRGCDVDEVRIAMAVEVGFEPGPNGVAIPSFVAVTP